MSVEWCPGKDAMRAREQVMPPKVVGCEFNCPACPARLITRKITSGGQHSKPRWLRDIQCKKQESDSSSISVI
jgi:hypothetical protein